MAERDTTAPHIHDVTELRRLQQDLERVILETQELKDKVAAALAANSDRDRQRVNPESRAVDRAKRAP